MSKKKIEKAGMQKEQKIVLESATIDNNVLNSFANKKQNNNLDTMDRIRKSTSEKLGTFVKKQNLKKNIFLSALVEWGLDIIKKDEKVLNEILIKYRNTK